MKYVEDKEHYVFHVWGSTSHFHGFQAFFELGSHWEYPQLPSYPQLMYIGREHISICWALPTHTHTQHPQHKYQKMQDICEKTFENLFKKLQR